MVINYQPPRAVPPRWIEESGWCSADTSRGPNNALRDEIDWADQIAAGDVQGPVRSPAPMLAVQAFCWPTDR